MNIIQPVATKPTAMPPRSFALYGEAKVGKSDLASKFPMPLFIDLENRLHNIAAPRTSLITSAADLKQVLAEILADHRAGKFPFATIVLDGLSTFVLSAGFHEDSKDSRAIAKAMAKVFLPALDDFFTLPLIRIITLHARVEKREKKVMVNGKEKTIEYTSIAPDLHPRIEQYLTARVDAIGYCQTKGGTRTITWVMQDTADGRIVAGNSLGLPASTPLSYADIARHLIAPAARQTLPSPAPAPVAETPASAQTTESKPDLERKADPVTGETTSPDGMPWCEWCGDKPSAPGVPCKACAELGATPASRPSLKAKTEPVPAPTPKAPVKPANGNGHSNGNGNGKSTLAKLVGITGQTYTEWKNLCAELAKTHKAYADTKGAPNNYHILGSAHKAGYPEITPANMQTVIEALAARHPIRDDVPF